MDGVTVTLVFLIGIALLFDFINGMHDAANSIATIVSTRVLKPQYAVLWAAFFNFIAAFSSYVGLGTHVAKSIASGVIDTSIVDSRVLLAVLLGAIFWNLLTWYYGLPVSSSHALVGGLIGGAIAKTGDLGALIWTVPGKLKGIAWICGFILIAPVVGMILGFSVMLAVMCASP